jgi:hypothetical protein
VGEIRTHEGLSPLAVFKTAAFNRSATTPQAPNFFSLSGLRNPLPLVRPPHGCGCGEECGEHPSRLRLCLQSPSRLIQPDIRVLAIEERLDLLLDNFIEYERDFLDPEWFRNSPRDL